MTTHQAFDIISTCTVGTTTVQLKETSPKYDQASLYLQTKANYVHLRPIGAKHFEASAIEIAISTDESTVAVTDKSYTRGLSNAIFTYHRVRGTWIRSPRALSYKKNGISYLLGTSLTLVDRGKFLETIATPTPRELRINPDLPSYYLRYRRIGIIYMLIHSAPTNGNILMTPSPI